MGVMIVIVMVMCIIFFPFSDRGDNFLVGAVIGVVPFRVLLIECIGLEFINLNGMKASSREGGLTQVHGLRNYVLK